MNRETRFALVRILNFVRFVVNPVFMSTKYSEGKTVHWLEVQGFKRTFARECAE
jgi:hypothetical protein